MKTLAFSAAVCAAVAACVGMVIVFLPMQFAAVWFAMQHPIFATDIRRQGDGVYWLALRGRSDILHPTRNDLVVTDQTQANAASHVWASAVAAYRYGAPTARVLGNFNEWSEDVFGRPDGVDPRNVPLDTISDQCNNAIGRAIGLDLKADNRSEAEILDRVLARMDRGEACGVWRNRESGLYMSVRLPERLSASDVAKMAADR